MIKKKIKELVFVEKIGNIMLNIPATPPKLRLNAHFGRVFYFKDKRDDIFMRETFLFFTIFLGGCAIAAYQGDILTKSELPF
jgi:hypothetical protein